MTTFDRYLLRRFWHAFFISFIAMMGLYIVIDAFNHVDNFFTDDTNTLAVMGRMAQFYAYRSCMFFDTIGHMIALTACLMALVLLQHHGELNPILAAGVPTYRLIFPLLWGIVFVDAVMVANKELVIPRIADQLQLQAGETGTDQEHVEPAYDHHTWIYFSGQTIVPAEKKMIEPKIVLPEPEIVKDQFMTVEADEAIYMESTTDGRRSGWLLKDASPRYEELQLTDWGRKFVTLGERAGDVFIATDVDIERLFNPAKNFELLSIPDLIRRIQNPAFDHISVRRQSLHLHARLIRPILDVILVFIGFPLLIRREARGLVFSLFLAAVVMGSVYGISKGFYYLGNAEMIAPDMAAWTPVIIAGAMAAWVSALVRT